LAYSGTGALPGAITYVLPGDSAATIQSKMNETQPGNSLVFTGGATYDFGGTTIVGKSGVTVWADGQVAINNAPGADTHGAFDFSGQSDWTIGGKAPGQGFVFNGSLIDATGASGNWTVGNCQFNHQQSSAWDGSAIRMNGASSGTIVNNDFTGVDGTVLGMYNLNKITISGNHFIDCWQPISIQEPLTTDTGLGQDIVIRNNVFLGTQRAAIEAGPATSGSEYFSGLVVDNNYFDNFNNLAEDGTLLAISLVGQSAENTTITNNFIRRGPADAGEIGVAIEMTGTGVVSGNTIADFSFAALTYQNGWNVSGNTVYNDGSSPYHGFANNGSGTGTFGVVTELTGSPIIPAMPARVVWGSIEGVVLTGDALANQLVGGAGNDTLNGGDGHDHLMGAAGADVMSGGSGNDTYVIVDAAGQVIEAADEGNDSVYTSVSYTLDAGQEIESLRAWGPADVILTGNETVNQVIGGAGTDTLNGGAGNDTLKGGTGPDVISGGTGDDTYVIDDAAGRVLEAVGEGRDVVYTTVSYTLDTGQEVESLRVTGTAGLTLTGNEIANELIGGEGNDTLNGGGGSDQLIGGAGGDRFLFTTPLVNGVSTTLSDFVPDTDDILLASSVFTAAGSVGALPAEAFFAGIAAQNPDERIIYDPTSGNLMYDSDGSGAAAATTFATLSPNLNLSAGDFHIV